MKKKTTDKEKGSKSSTQSAKIQIKGPGNKQVVNFKPTVGSEEPTRYIGQSQAADTLRPNSAELRAAEADGTKIVEAVLNITQRRKRSNQMRRLSKKLARLRMVARNQMAPEKRLKYRSQKLARNIIRKRFAGSRGASYGDLSVSDKISVDKMISGKAKLIARIAQRMMPVVRKAEQLRLQGVRTGRRPKKVKNGALGIMPNPKMVRSSYDYEREADIISENIALCILEGKAERIDQLMRAGLADRDSIQQYKKALSDPELAKRYSVVRDKAFDMLDKLIDVIANDPTIFYRAKDNIQKKHDFNPKNDKKKLKEEVLVEKQDIHPSLKKPGNHPSHAAAAKLRPIVQKITHERMAMAKKMQKQQNNTSAVKSKTKPAAKKTTKLKPKKPAGNKPSGNKSGGHSVHFRNGKISSIRFQGSN